MTVLDERPPQPDPAGALAPEALGGRAEEPAAGTSRGEELAPEDAAAGADGEQPGLRSVRLSSVTLATVLSGLAAAWLVARLFRGGIEPFAAVGAGVAVGVILTWLSFRTSRPTVLQAAVLPVSAIVGALFVLPSTTAGADLPYLIGQALRAGGLRQAPVAFAPGWAFIGVVVTAATVAAALSLAVSLGRARLAVVVPLPLTVAAALLQPPGAELASSIVAILLAIGGLLVSYGSELGAGQGLGAQFETRRLVRGGLLLLVVVAALVGLSRTSFLFPATNRSDIIPPRKPPPPVALPDRTLFTVRSSQPGPWRVGTLDGYGQDALLLPPTDPNRAKPVPASGRVASAGRHPTYSATFTVDVLPGRTLPTPAQTVSISGHRGGLEYDPRTDDVQLADTSIPPHYSYTVTAQAPPTGKELAEAPAPTPAMVKDYTVAPPAPAIVKRLLAAIPPQTDAFDRLEALRQDLYDKVVLAGTGNPVDIPPSLVARMLEGGEATPYEVDAAQVLLARWAGIPARLGYGFYGGTRHGSVVSFGPADGSAWLEAWFQGYGWVPIVGTPPKATPSISRHLKKSNPLVLPTDQLAITVYVPVQLPSYRQLFEVVRWWVLFSLPFLAGAGLVLWGYPWPLKLLRSRRRRRWARGRGRGPAARIAAAYSELRDRARDLNIGTGRETPLEFLEVLAADDEHTELAWLVTRGLWGDLARDLRLEDVEYGEEMAASVRRRLSQDQTGLNRILAAVARTSLREPWSNEVPNRRARREAATPLASEAPSAPPGAPGRARRRGRRAARLAGAAAAVVALGSCSNAAPTAPVGSLGYPARLAPASVGPYRVVPAPSLSAYYAKAGSYSEVTSGHVFEIRDSQAIQGTFQVALFKPGIDSQQRSVQQQVESGLGAAVAVTRHFGLIRLRVLYVPEQQVFLWFPPDHNVMELFVMRESFTAALPVTEAIIGYQTGLTLPGEQP